MRIENIEQYFQDEFKNIDLTMEWSIVTRL